MMGSEHDQQLDGVVQLRTKLWSWHALMEISNRSSSNLANHCKRHFRELSVGEHP